VIFKGKQKAKKEDPLSYFTQMNLHSAVLFTMQKIPAILNCIVLVNLASPPDTNTI